MIEMQGDVKSISGAPYFLYETSFLVGPNQFTILFLLKNKPDLTNAEIKENKHVGSANGIYTLQKNGFVYSVRDRAKKSATIWNLTNLGLRFLDEYESCKTFTSFQKWVQYKHKKIKLPMPTLESNESKCKHSYLPYNGKCLNCNEVDPDFQGPPEHMK